MVDKETIQPGSLNVLSAKYEVRYFPYFKIYPNRDEYVVTTVATTLMNPTCLQCLKIMPDKFSDDIEKLFSFQIETCIKKIFVSV